jgi:hypothetical protein
LLFLLEINIHAFSPFLLLWYPIAVLTGAGGRASKRSLIVRFTVSVLTGAGGRASKRSLIVRFTVSGQVPCSGAERRNKVLDEVGTAIHGGAAAVNAELTGTAFSCPVE